MVVGCAVAVVGATGRDESDLSEARRPNRMCDYMRKFLQVGAGSIDEGGTPGSASLSID